MNSRSIEDAALDGMLSQAAKEALPLWLEQMETEYPALETAPVSKALDKRIRRMSKQLSHTKRWNTASKAAFRFAAVLVLVMTLGFGLVVSVEAVRVEVINFLIDWRETHAAFGANPLSSAKLGTSGVEYAPAYIPEGFELSNVIDLNNSSVLEYTSADGGYIAFNWSRLDSTSKLVDTEQRTYQSILLGEHPAHLFTAKSSEYYSQLIWDDGIMMFDVTSTLPTEEIIRIAESVEKIS